MLPARESEMSFLSAPTPAPRVISWSGGSSTRNCTLYNRTSADWSGSEPNCTSEWWIIRFSSYQSVGFVNLILHCTFKSLAWQNEATLLAHYFAVIKCARHLPNPTNGKVTCTRDRGVFSECAYSCSMDYQLVGGSCTRNCTLYNGTYADWSGSEPNCTSECLY